MLDDGACEADIIEMPRLALSLLLFASACASAPQDPLPAATVPPEVKFETVRFSSGQLALGGLWVQPAGPGPFPAVLYNHGSAPGSLNDEAARAIAPHFVARGWAFFMPYRRGQGLSADAGPYLGDEIARARKKSLRAASALLVARMTGMHFDDQMAALTWLRARPEVDARRIAVMGNSFGGVQALLGAARPEYCAAVDAAGGAESWAKSPELRATMKRAAWAARAPVFFFSAENDFDVSPTRELAATMAEAGRRAEMMIFPAFGESARDGHAFAYRGAEIWGGPVTAFLARECGDSKTGR